MKMVDPRELRASAKAKAAEAKEKNRSKGRDRNKRAAGSQILRAQDEATALHAEQIEQIKALLAQEKAAHAATRRALSAARRDLSAAQVEVERSIAQHMHELTHRSKNLLAVIAAMARQTARQGGTMAAFLERFGARVQALARSHDLLVQESWLGVSLQDLIRSQLAPYFDRDHPQISLEGPRDLQLRPEAAQSFGLALHELAANAARYGALSRMRGHVTISWRILPPEQDGALEIFWQESGGPKVGHPRRQGFGRLVIEHNLPRVLNGKVELQFAEQGLSCRVDVPVLQFQHCPPSHPA